MSTVRTGGLHAVESRSQNLATLLRALPDAEITGPTNLPVHNVRVDSRQVQPGDLFVAVTHPGYQNDGHKFVTDAISLGAIGVVVDRPLPVPEDRARIIVPETAKALSLLSAASFRWPTAQLGIVGVTGTDGKTTTTTLIAGALLTMGLPTAQVSTVSLGVGNAIESNKSRQSTPDAPTIQRLLARAVKRGITYAVIEATSHGLVQDRLHGTEIDIAVYTNITHEHLDYHGSIEAYVAAKARLLGLQSAIPGVPQKTYPFPKAAVLNADDEYYAHLHSLADVPVTTYGINQCADVRATNIKYDGLRPVIQVRTPWGNARLRPKLLGTFNVANVLASLTTLGLLTESLDASVEALCLQPGVPGRMELIDSHQRFSVIVDYAHTPASLDAVLKVIRRLTRNRLIAVFGSAGERDREKRPMMGRIAAQQADFFVLTNEDPRGEDPTAILEEIAGGAETAGARRQTDFVCEPDRRTAIRLAFERAGPGDTILLAGKGHEQSIILNGHSEPWDERAVARELLGAQ